MLGKAELPWWACGVLAIALMNARSIKIDRPNAPERSLVASQLGHTRRLAGETNIQTAQDTTEAPEGPEAINITIPCTLGADPCGVVLLNATGELKVKTWVGVRVIKGYKESAEELKTVKTCFAWITISVSVALCLLYFVFILVNENRRQQLVDAILCMILGKMDDDAAVDDFADELPPERREKELDPDHPQFIAPGNIYRVLAVLHPGHIGWFKWFHFIGQAFVVAYMQLYLPLGIVNDLFEDWEMNSVKSPLWFVEHGFTFLTQFGALASVLGIFSGLCETTIRTGCKANYYILSHVEPVRPPLSKAEEEEMTSFLPRVTPVSKAALVLSAFSSAPEKQAEDVAFRTLPFGGKKLARSAKRAMETGDITEAVPRPIMDPRFVKINAGFWVSISMFMNITMTLLLQLVMILKVATYHEKIQDVALVCVSLYFIFDLDDKVMETTPGLKVRYGHAVQKLTMHQFFDPSWMYRVGMSAIYFSRRLTMVGLWVIIVVGWKSRANPGLFIGGDPFSQFD